MINKHPLRPDRLRQIPTSFSWVDHRLVRHDYLRRAEPRAWALYLFLITVGDVNGLSYYSDRAIARHLNLEAPALSAARQQLLQADLIAYQKPLYQVLALPEDPREAVASTAPRTGQVRCLSDILRCALEGGAA
jgi:hypothetical protein